MYGKEDETKENVDTYWYTLKRLQKGQRKETTLGLESPRYIDAYLEGIAHYVKICKAQP